MIGLIERQGMRVPRPQQPGQENNREKKRQWRQEGQNRRGRVNQPGLSQTPQAIRRMPHRVGPGIASAVAFADIVDVSQIFHEYATI